MLEQPNRRGNAIAVTDNNLFTYDMGMGIDTGNNMDSMGTDDNIHLVEGDIG